MALNNVINRVIGNAINRAYDTAMSTKTAQIENDMIQRYEADSNINAGTWFFDYNSFYDNILTCSQIISGLDTQISMAQTACLSVVGKMSSPEGKDIESKIGACFTDIINGAYSVKSGVSYLMQWSLKRFSDGVRAGKISMQTVNQIGELLGLRF